MLQQLINHSPDLKRLVDEGYEIETKGGLLVAHHIPYVTPAKEVKYGKLVCALTLAGPNRTGRPPDHTIYFSGETPCNADGIALTAIINNSNRQQLAEGLIVNHYFSSKPMSGNYADYYEKIRTYSEILSAQARAINCTVTSKPNSKKAA
jgi:hypothetical protein